METAHRTKEIVRAKEEVIGVEVINNAREKLGKIYEICLEKYSGQVIYLVLESGSFLGLGGKLFAIPWKSIHYNPEEESFVLNISKDRLKNAPGFDKNNWPTFTDESYGKTLIDFYGSSTTR